MRIVLAGLGSIGRRHLQTLRAGDGAAVTIWHHRRGASGAEAREVDGPVVFTLAEALAARPDAVVVTRPASCHVPTALEFARRGIHVFVEKPLAASLDGVDELIETCRKNGVMLMVGYCFRFYRPLQALRQALLSGRIGRVLSVRAEVGQYLPDWRPGTDYRTGASARRELGGGALLELSHEIDYVRWLVGEISSVTARMGRLSELDTDVEDVAELILEFDTGALGNVHLDLVQRAAARDCRVIGTTGTLAWDGTTHKVRWYSAASQAWCILHPADAAAYGDMYRAELDDFVRAVDSVVHHGATGEDGRRVLQIIAAARRSAHTGSVVVV